MLKISRYTILLSSILLSGFLTHLSAQEKKDTAKVKIPLYQGFTVELDAAALAEKFISGGVSYGMQGNVQFNLKRKYFPVLEIGYGEADKTLQNGVAFAGKGVFEKIGIDYNLIKDKAGGKLYNNFFLVGMRLGMSQMNYSINGLYNKDGYWGKSEAVDLSSIKTSKYWIEVVAGVRVEIYKRVTMGWNVRNKRLFGDLSSGEVYPWYIPGYGKAGTSVWGFSYVIGYRF